MPVEPVRRARPCDHAAMARDDRAGAQAPRRATRSTRTSTALGVVAPAAAATRGRPRAARSISAGPRARPTAGPCCRWRGGTARPTGGRPTSCAGAGRRFGGSGAALVWGGEAVAVRADGRAEPAPARRSARARSATSPQLRTELLAGHAEAHRRRPRAARRAAAHPLGPLVAPGRRARAAVAYRHPLLDERVGADRRRRRHRRAGSTISSATFVAAAAWPREAGFDFVDVKHCHGYLLHELLSAATGPGRYGGDARRPHSVPHGGRRRRSAATRPACRSACGCRPSTSCPTCAAPDGRGVPAATGPYPYAFGGDGTGLGVDLDEVHDAVRAARRARRRLLCVTAGSPTTARTCSGPRTSRRRTATCRRAIRCSRSRGCSTSPPRVTARIPALTVVASGLSYLQEWMPAVAAGVVADGRRRRSSATGAGCSRTRSCRPTCSRARDRSGPRLCRTFQRLHDRAAATASSRAATRSTRYYKARPERLELDRGEARRRGR